MLNLLKKITSILFVLAIMFSTANAVVSNNLSFLNNIIDTSGNYSLNFDISAKANKLFPFDDAQTQVYNKAIEKFKLSLSFKQYGDKTVNLSKLSYAGDEVFSQAEVKNNNIFYVLNSLIDFRILAKDGSSPLSMLNLGGEVIETKYSFNPLVAKDLHHSLIQPLIDTLPDGKKTKTNAKFKETANAKTLYTYVISKDDIDKYADLITTVMLVGIDANIQTEMGAIPYGKWEIKDYLDANDNRVAIKFEGRADFLDGTKRKIEFLTSFNNAYNSYRYELNAVSTNSRNDYYNIVASLKDENSIVINSEYDRKTRVLQSVETINSDIILNKSQNITQFDGNYEYKTETTADDVETVNSYKITPNIKIINNNNVYTINGNASLNVIANNANTINMELDFSDPSNVEKALDYEKAIVLAVDNGGVEQNITNIQSSLESYIVNKDFGLQYINMDEWNDVYIKSINDELNQKTASRLLKIMINQDDMSVDVLSYGMTSDDWNKFLETVNHIKEKN